MSLEIRFTYLFIIKVNGESISVIHFCFLFLIGVNIESKNSSPLEQIL